MTSRCSMCGNRFDILDTYRCNSESCNAILCAPCSKVHAHVKSQPGTCACQEGEECGGCYQCFPDKFKCDCRQYTNLGHCVHVAALSGW